MGGGEILRSEEVGAEYVLKATEFRLSAVVFECYYDILGSDINGSQNRREAMSLLQELDVKPNYESIYDIVDFSEI